MALYGITLSMVISMGLFILRISKKETTNALAGTYKTTDNLNIRAGAGTNKSIMVTIPKGTAVKNYGYYTKVNGTKWLYVQFTYNNVTYTGFGSGKYLKK